MKNQKTADFYNKFYAENETAYTGEPTSLVAELPELMPAGTILEIGASVGRNALFLASKGYEVMATDISSVAIERLTRQAQEQGLAIDAAVSDIAEDGIQGCYDAIICTMTFHQLSTEDAEAAIKQMQEHTNPGGFNIVTTFNKNNFFYRNNPDTPNFYPDGTEQLEQLYSGWRVERSVLRESKALDKDADGNRYPVEIVGLIAQKI